MAFYFTTVILGHVTLGQRTSCLAGVKLVILGHVTRLRDTWVSAHAPSRPPYSFYNAELPPSRTSHQLETIHQFPTGVHINNFELARALAGLSRFTGKFNRLG